MDEDTTILDALVVYLCNRNVIRSSESKLKSLYHEGQYIQTTKKFFQDDADRGSCRPCPAYTDYTAFQMDDTLFSDAVAQKVILVSPTTLLTTLRTIESIWRYEKQSRNAQEIAQRAGALYDKFCLFAEDMVRMGTQIDTLRNSYDSAMTRLSRGRGNLVSRVELFPQMGVKVKKSLSATIATDEDQ